MIRKNKNREIQKGGSRDATTLYNCLDKRNRNSKTWSGKKKGEYWDERKRTACKERVTNHGWGSETATGARIGCESCVSKSLAERITYVSTFRQHTSRHSAFVEKGRPPKSEWKGIVGQALKRGVEGFAGKGRNRLRGVGGNSDS